MHRGAKLHLTQKLCTFFAPTSFRLQKHHKIIWTHVVGKGILFDHAVFFFVDVLFCLIFYADAFDNHQSILSHCRVINPVRTIHLCSVMPGHQFLAGLPGLSSRVRVPRAGRAILHGVHARDSARQGKRSSGSLFVPKIK